MAQRHLDTPALETILSNLKVVSEARSQTDHQTVVKKYEKELKKFDSIYVVPENDHHLDGVMKVLAVAVHETIQRKVDLKKVDPKDMKNYDTKRLATLLEVDSLDKCFLKEVNDKKMFKNAKSPLDMANYLKLSVTQTDVKNIIENQFQIKWNTKTAPDESPDTSDEEESPDTSDEEESANTSDEEESANTTNEQESADTSDEEESANTTDTGPPANYTFYQFCDRKRTMRLFKYIPRLAHVKTTLYKKYRKEGISNLQRIAENETKLCPKVYIKIANGWKIWDADTEKFEDNEHHQLSWIDKSIKTFIDENADEQAEDNLKQCLSKPTLYWAVLKDGDFIPGKNLKLESISQTQVYVGKANNGIRGRWTKDSDNHCKMMKKCVDNVCAMTTYDPLRLEGIQLVDVRLALAKVRGEETALFVIKTFGDEVEKTKLKLRASLNYIREFLKKIRRQRLKTQYSNTKLKKIRHYEFNVLSDKVHISSDKAEENLDSVENYLDKAKEYLDQVQLPRFPDQTTIKELQKELAEAKTRVDDLRIASNTSKPMAVKLLEKAEGRHRIGKKDIGTDNIIPYDELKDTWSPKDMRYGMNF